MTNAAGDRRISAAAWGVSLAAHALLTLSAAWGIQSGLEPGGDEPAREVGIVLRQSDQPPTPFEAESAVDSNAIEPVEMELIEFSEASTTPGPFSDLLNELLETPPEGAGPPSTDGGSGNPAQPPPAGGGRPKLPIGQARVPFYGVEGVGSRFVFALDRSESMRGGRLRSAKAELVASLEAIQPANQFHILFFNTRIAALDLSGQRRLAFGTDENKTRAARFIRGVTSDGGTERKHALDRALRLRPDVIFFLTDDDTPMTPAEMAEIIGEARGAVTIHCVEFGQGPDHGRRNFLTELAAATGGERCYVDTSLLPR